MAKQAIVLGSTGSIGRNTLDVLSRLDDWEVVGLAAGTSSEELADQANEHRPLAIAIASESQLADLRNRLTYKPSVFAGEDALVELVRQTDSDCVVSAVVGAGGLEATILAVEQGRRVALANKESLVIAGSLIMTLAREKGATIIPIDSEHSAIFQALLAGRTGDVAKIYLTSSGGPFRECDTAEMERATLDDAMQHPVWDMGPKITIDSATMMNKALEIIEARWLFDMPAEQIGVVVHPESIIHSMVEFHDGSLIAQMGTPDMRTPIQYALTYPARVACPSERLDLTTLRTLTLHPPDHDRFPALRLGYQVARQGGTAGAVLNAANEAAVQMFRDGAIRFGDIARFAERTLQDHAHVEDATLSDLLEADRWAREEVIRCKI